MQTGSDKVIRVETAEPELARLAALPIVTLSINSLLLDNSPRQGGDNEEHIRVLAESEDELPPIVVHDPSMRVIDGIHRVRAAIMRGAESIDAKIYHGTDEDAFVIAVRLNISHGLPLTRADRTTAALRIIGSHPQWSDRMIATAVGLSAGTVARVRRCSTAHNAQSTARVGKDGRVRPVDGVAGRLRAAEFLIKRPASPIRSIAKEAGVSPSTVHDVQQRLRAGQHPLPDHHREPQPPTTPRPAGGSSARGVHGHPASPAGIDAAAILTGLKKDPVLQRTDPARSLVRYLDKYGVGMAARCRIVEMVPDHCAYLVAELARKYAQTWTDIANQLEQRSPSGPRGPALQPRTLAALLAVSRNRTGENVTEPAERDPGS